MENKKINVLGIAPYEGMRNIMLSLAEKRNDIEIEVITADLDFGVREVLQHSVSNYDAIISRGATAKEISKVATVPVIEVPLSVYDILRAIKITEHYSGQYAIVGFSEVTKAAVQLCNLLQYEIDIYTVNQKSDIPIILNELKENNCTIILCDASTETIAKNIGLNPILITSGADSIQTAFDAAINLCQGVRNLQKQNILFKETLKAQTCSTFIINKNRDVLFSSSHHPEENSNVIDYLSNLIHELERTSFEKAFHLIHDILYAVSLHTVSLYSDTVYIFTVESNPVPQSGSKYGIHFSNSMELRNNYYNSFYCLTSGATSMEERIKRINKSLQAVMILGEKGTGKDQVATKLYIESNLATKPYISINCELLNNKYWDYLINNYNSPLCDNDNTIFISNIQALSSLQRKNLLSVALDTNLGKRNRLIFSCSKSLANSNEDPARDFIEYLPCVTLNLPPLRELSNDLSSSSSLYLNKLNVELSKEVIGLEPDAMEILKSYSWPQNYMQLKRVLAELVMLTDTPYIHANLVTQLIDKEKLQFPETNFANSSNFNYNRTLDEMIKEIVNNVVLKNNGNQSKAAKQLGISRTTLWRYLK